MTGLDFEDRAIYELTIQVTDLNGRGASALGTVIVDVLDIPDCAVSQLFLSSAQPPVFATAGGEVLHIVGQNLGPTASRTDFTSIDIAVSYRDSADIAESTYIFSALDCYRDTSSLSRNRDVYCFTVPGVGQNMGVVISITTNYLSGPNTCVTTFSSPKMSYRKPQINAMSNHTGMPTAGNAKVTIEGANFGPIADFNHIRATYGISGTEYETDCSLVEADTTVECDIQEGKPDYRMAMHTYRNSPARIDILCMTVCFICRYWQEFILVVAGGRCRFTYIRWVILPASGYH